MCLFNLPDFLIKSEKVHIYYRPYYKHYEKNDVEVVLVEKFVK
jgi:hypothetical protein